MQSDTLQIAVDRFLRVKNNHQTRSWYFKNLKPMIEYMGAARPVDEITRRDAEDYWDTLSNRTVCWEDHPSKPTRNRPPSTTTLKNFLRAARTFWTEMVRQRVIDFNPFDHIPLPNDTRPAAMKAIQPDDLRAIWHAARRSGTRDYAIVTVLATTGMRAGELVSMTVHDLNLERGEAWVRGKRGWRQVFLGEASVTAIKSYLEERATDQGSELWISGQGGGLTEDGVRQMIYRIAEKAGIRGRRNLHSFRHRLAQSWLDKGVIPEIVAQALGHANVSVTLSIYGNQDSRRVRQTMQKSEMAPFIDMFAIEMEAATSTQT